MLHRHRLIVTLVAAFSCSARADVVFVDAANCPGPGDGSELNPYCSIQAAIDNAVDTDEILVAPAIYFETIDFLGKAITLRSSGGPDVTTIDAQGNGTVVTCTSGEGPNTVLEGFALTGGSGTLVKVFPPEFWVVGGGMYNLGSNPTVTNCTFIDNSTTVDRGGGMFNDFSSPTVTNCTFSGNSAQTNGGGMLNWLGSDPTLTNCTFIGNSAGYYGGGIYNVGSSPTVIDCSFDGNSATNAGGGGIAHFGGGAMTVTGSTFIGNSTPILQNHAGGAILSGSSHFTITDSVFHDNAAYHGGALANLALTFTIQNCLMTGNFGAVGGAVFNQSSGMVTLTNCIILGNVVREGPGVGGAIYNSAALDVVNTLIALNVAQGDGGAIFDASLNAFAQISNTTITLNSAGGSGGGVFLKLNSQGTVVNNSILWANSDAGGQDESAQIHADGPAFVYYSCVEGLTGGLGGVGNIDTDPLFVDPAGGDLRLLPGSPCIDAAHNIFVPAGITTDLDGNPRTVDDLNTPDCQQAPGQCGDAPVVDMGAYELQFCPWDCGGDNDGTVGIVDFLALLAQWGGSGSCDFDGGGVGITDFLALLVYWGPCP